MSPAATDASRFESIQLFTGAADADASLVDLLDNVLNHGVVLRGDLILGLANVDLIYVQLSVLLAAADRVFGPVPDQPRRRRRVRSHPARRNLVRGQKNQP